MSGVKFKNDGEKELFDTLYNGDADDEGFGSLEGDFQNFGQEDISPVNVPIGFKFSIYKFDVKEKDLNDESSLVQSFSIVNKNFEAVLTGCQWLWNKELHDRNRIDFSTRLMLYAEVYNGVDTIKLFSKNILYRFLNRHKESVQYMSWWKIDEFGEEITVGASLPILIQ